MNKITIYLANLSHVRDGYIATEAIPLNIGYLATYLKKYLPDSLDIKLFNLPSELEAAVKNKVPHFILFSNYIWNFNLNYFYLSHFKAKYPNIITIMGGPNYPGKEDLQEAFLKKYDKIDFYVYLEGEITLLNLIKTVIDADLNIENTKKTNLKGCHYLSNGKCINGGEGERVKNLDEFPSPYLLGLFDKMLKDGFVPMLETNRGCPFTCAYCFSSNKYYRKVHKFSLERIENEIEYIAKRVKAKSLHIADSNYGILNQDFYISSKLKECKEKFGWPLKINLSTSKINKDRVVRCISPLGKSVLFSASMQSMNEKTLAQVKRKNLTFAQYKNIIGTLKKNNVHCLCELILGMPEETKASHLMAIKEALEADIDKIGVYTCMLLKNTPLLESKYFDQFSLERKYRVLPRDFGIYMGEKILETEQVSVASKTLTFEDYLWLRGFNFIVASYQNLGVFNEIMGYMKYLKVSIFELSLKIHDQIQHDGSRAGEIYRQFIIDTKTELWNSEEEIIEYFSNGKNFTKLLKGELGANLIQKYQAVMLDNLQSFTDLFSKVILDNYDIADESFIKDLTRFSLSVRNDLFSETNQTQKEIFQYNIPNWIASKMTQDIKEFKKKTTLTFFHDQKQKEILNNYIEFYGNSEDSRGKILTRVDLSLLYRRFRCN